MFIIFQVYVDSNSGFYASPTWKRAKVLLDRCQGAGKDRMDFMGHGHFSFVPLLQRVLFQLLFQAETQGERRGFALIAIT